MIVYRDRTANHYLYSEQAVADFFAPASQKKPEKITWRILNNSLIIGKYATEHADKQRNEHGVKRKIAAFDFVSLLFCPLVIDKTYN